MSELREEAETMIAEQGWTKLAIQRLRKVDSFLKESHRLNGALSRQFIHPFFCWWPSLFFLGSVVMARKARKNCTLSDGTVLPPGTYVAIAAEAMSKSEVCSLVLVLLNTAQMTLRTVFVPGCRNVQGL